MSNSESPGPHVHGNRQLVADHDSRIARALPVRGFRLQQILERPRDQVVREIGHAPHRERIDSAHAHAEDLATATAHHAFRIEIGRGPRDSLHAAHRTSRTPS